VVSQIASALSRPMQRKLVTLVNCQLVEEEGRVRALRAARSLGERTITELILQHQNPQQLSANLWAAVRARGCQFLGPDSAVPSWEELESVMLAVKLVVHGLVEFIQNFSKKSHETFPSQPNSKYKTSMCRDLRQQGTCPRGVNCTFAHTQDELEKYRMRNKKVSSGTRPSLLSKTGGVKSSGVDVCVCEQEGVASESSSPTHLVPRGGEQEEVLMKELADGFRATNQDLKTGSPPKSPVSGGSADPSVLLKPSSLPQRAHHEVPYFPEQRSVYDLPSCPSGNFFPAPVSNSQKHYLPRFPRSSPASDSSAPPPLAPPYPDQPLQSRLGLSPYPASPSYPPLPHSHPHGHGVYAPVYDSRRLWRPQLYHRQDGRSNSLPLEVLHSSIYHPPLRERFNSLDSAYCSASDRRAALHREAYGRAALGSEDFYSLRQDQWSHQHHGSGRVAQHSPVYTVDLCSELHTRDFTSVKH
ncbi:roquin-2, partial [Tachysurus ichikawai]